MHNNFYDNYQFDYFQYKKRITKTNNFVIPLLITLIILLSGLVIFFKPINKNELEFYFVEIGCFSGYKQANELALKLQNEGGAGYIYYNKNYHVLASFYTNYDDAEKVCNSIQNEYKNSTVYTLKANQFLAQKNLTKTQNEIIKNLSSFLQKNIIKLSELSIFYDKQELNQNQISTSLTYIYDEFKKLKNEFNTQFKTNSKYNTAKDTLLSIETNLLSIKNFNFNNNFFIKYQIIDIVINYCSFLSCF